MAQLALAVGGAAAGSSLFGRVGAQIGFLGGSLVGAWLFAPRTTIEGPRLDDLNVTVSTYGIPIPIGYGTPRMSGNVIWSTGLIEIKNKKKVGGKGGPSTTQISYTYKASFAVAFARREAYSVLRIWGDSKLIYDITSTGGVPNNQVSKDLNFRFYSGTATQTVDPLIESLEGINESPAYRDTVYIVFEDMDLLDFGNRIPSITAEIAFAGTDDFPYTKLTVDNATTLFPAGNCWTKDPFRPFLYCTYLSRIAKFNSVTGAFLQGTTFIMNGTEEGTLSGPPAVDDTGYLYVQVGGQGAAPYYKIDPNSLEPIAGIGTSALTSLYPRRMSNLSDAIAAVIPQFGDYKNCVIVTTRGGNDGIKAFCRDKTVAFPVGAMYDIHRNPARLPELAYLGVFYLTDCKNGSANDWPSQLAIDKNKTIWVGCRGVSSTAHLYKIHLIAPALDDFDFAPEHESTMVCTGEMYDLSAYLTNCRYVTYVEDDHTLIIATNGGATSPSNNWAVKFDIETETVVATYSNSVHSCLGLYGSGMFRLGPQNGKILLADGQNGVLLDTATLKQLEDRFEWGSWKANDRRGYVWDSRSDSVFWAVNTGLSLENEVYRYWLHRKTGMSEALDTVVTDICNRCFLTGLIDTTDLAADSVRAYAIGRQMNGRAALNPLSLGFLFDAVETDWILKFYKRGRAAVFAIPESDLGAHSQGAHPETNIVETFIQQIEIPEMIHVKYIDVDKDHQTGLQYAKRHADVMNSGKKQTMELAIGFMASEAKTLARTWLYQINEEQANIELSLGTKWLALDPTDVGTVTDESIQHTLSISTIQLNDLIIGIRGIQTDTQIFTQSATGDKGGGGGQSLALPGATELFLIDTSLLRDYDEAQGITAPLYLATAAYTDDWIGAVVFKATDGINFLDVVSSTNTLSWGTALTQLTASTNWATWDRFRTLTVAMQQGTPETATELAVLNGANAALLGNPIDGWEVIQWATVTDLGDGQYKLENLLRARRGTDAFMEHIVGDLFIILEDNTLLKHPMTIAEIGAIRYFRAVTIGGVFDNAVIKEITFVGNALKPYSPGDIRGARDGSGNLTITWQRRTRYGGAWRDGTGAVPLGETTEAYELDILNSGGTIVRTIASLTSETASYTAAQQVIDFGSTQSALNVAVYQLSRVVGRGNPGWATI